MIAGLVDLRAGAIYDGDRSGVGRCTERVREGSEHGGFDAVEGIRLSSAGGDLRRHFGLAPPKDKVLEPLINDLRSIEKDGIIISVADKTINFVGTVVAVLGDNLGSRQIGGFTQNFHSSNYFCRFCDITQNQLQLRNMCTNINRNPNNYNLHVKQAKITMTIVKGVKQDSPSNKLDYFHVCNPGLPPCIAHDLFEGIVPYDVMYCIKYFVKESWFTFDFFNFRLKKIKILNKNAYNNVSLIKASDCKLTGTASQIKRLLLIFPLAVYDSIKDTEDNTWLLVLHLHEICSLVCAPALSIGQVVLLQEKINEYLFKLLSQKYQFLQSQCSKDIYSSLVEADNAKEYIPENFNMDISSVITDYFCDNKNENYSHYMNVYFVGTTIEVIYNSDFGIYEPFEIKGQEVNLVYQAYQVHVSHHQQMKQYHIKKQPYNDEIWINFRLLWATVETAVLKELEARKRNKYVIHAVVNHMDEDGNRFGDGIHTLYLKLRDRNSYLNRPHMKRSLIQTLNIPLKEQKKVLSTKAGCSNWQPEKYLESETEETIESKTEFLRQVILRQESDRSKKKIPLKNRHTAEKVELSNENISSSAKKLKTDRETFAPNIGYRILNFLIVFSALSECVKCKKCDSNVQFSIESTRGLGFKIVVSCLSCKPTFIPSCPYIKTAYEINTRFFFVMRLLGIGLRGAMKTKLA
ncbi:hypothetical protein ALC57_15752 [Trachymyrmex cornetzi]|uniref:Uncharacterized protein n=1 Tax=Trachymyrmex cornetzi TaxID=471704 RepID=A0A151IW89_9HYME|nr:hypothetical protein ALC57_15752 [Trachymyrmex cornetzi]